MYEPEETIICCYINKMLKQINIHLNEKKSNFNVDLYKKVDIIEL